MRKEEILELMEYRQKKRWRQRKQKNQRLDQRKQQRENKSDFYSLNFSKYLGLSIRLTMINNFFDCRTLPCHEILK